MGYFVFAFSGFIFLCMGALERKLRNVEAAIKELDDGYI
jgi:hypothetical protein